MLVEEKLTYGTIFLEFKATAFDVEGKAMSAGDSGEAEVVAGPATEAPPGDISGTRTGRSFSDSVSVGIWNAAMK